MQILFEQSFSHEAFGFRRRALLIMLTSSASLLMSRIGGIMVYRFSGVPQGLK